MPSALSASLDVASKLLTLADSDEGKAMLRRLLGMNKPTPEELAAVLRQLPVPQPPRKR